MGGLAPRLACAAAGDARRRAGAGSLASAPGGRAGMGERGAQSSPRASFVRGPGNAVRAGGRAGGARTQWRELGAPLCAVRAGEGARAAF